MEKKYLLSAFSKDRPGIVADISRVIYENGYNLEDSSMTYLAGEFAILLMLSAPAGVSQQQVDETLSAECRRLEREKDITAYFRPLLDESPVVRNNFTEKTIVVEGLDQAGIVYRISSYLADSRINIRTLETKTTPSPQSGSDYYTMTMVVEIPLGLELGKVEEELGIIGDQLNVDVAIT